METTQLSQILLLEEKIRLSENNIRNIKKDFLKTNTPKYNLSDKYIITKIDNGILFEITSVGTTYNKTIFSRTTSSSLNYLCENKNEKYFKMLEADNGLMFVYQFTECGKNGKAKKIGAKKHILTEYEMENYIKEEILEEVE